MFDMVCPVKIWDVEVLPEFVTVKVTVKGPVPAEETVPEAPLGQTPPEVLG